MHNLDQRKPANVGRTSILTSASVVSTLSARCNWDPQWFDPICHAEVELVRGLISTSVYKISFVCSTLSSPRFQVVVGLSQSYLEMWNIETVAFCLQDGPLYSSAAVLPPSSIHGTINPVGTKGTISPPWEWMEHLREMWFSDCPYITPFKKSLQFLNS